MWKHVEESFFLLNNDDNDEQFFAMVDQKNKLVVFLNRIMKSKNPWGNSAENIHGSLAKQATKTYLY